MKGFLLVHAEAGAPRRVATAILRIDGVTDAEVVSGPYDVIVRVDAKDERDLEGHAVALIQAIPGVIRVVACPVGPYHLTGSLAVG
jgi:DNA-binding Lrp family transcriptional regulator